MKVETVRGAQAIRQLIDGLYQKTKPEMVYGISNLDKLQAAFKEYEYASANPSRLAAGIPSRTLYTQAAGPVYKSSDHLNNRESRYLPSQLSPFEGDMSIIGSHVIFVSFEPAEPVGLHVGSRTFAGEMTSLFNLLWKLVESYN